MEIIIEVLGTTNNVLERKKFNQELITIGRGYGNDLIINDEHADAEHARLQVDDEGGWWIIDQGSVNGIRRSKGRQKVEREAISSGDIFFFGRNKVRIFFGDHPVAAAVRIRWVESFLLWLGKPVVLVAMIVSYVLVQAIASYHSTIGEFDWSNFFSQNLSGALGFVALAVAVYFLSVLFRRGGNFMSHISVLVAVFLLSALFDFLIRLAKFNAGDSQYGLIGGVESFTGYLIVFLYLWSVLYLAFHFSLKRRTWVSLTVLGVIVVFNVLQDQMLSEWMDSGGYPMESALLPPAFLLTEPISSEDYSARAEQAFARVDELRLEAIQERDEAEAERAGTIQVVNESPD